MSRLMRLYGFLLLVFASTTAYAETTRPTALDVFRQMPATIFENTAEGLTEDEKLQLTEQGESHYWAIVTDTPDRLVVASLPFLESRVAVHLFLNDSNTGVAVVGTNSGAACTIEVWRLETGGRLVPAAGPDEPPASDFFVQGNSLPEGIDPSIMLCLGDANLEARPLFWTETGLADIKPDNTVDFIWNGRTFEKRIRPAASGNGQANDTPDTVQQ